MEYRKFPIEFVDRTKHLLECYEGDFEVTNLINCLLGLIILPFEFASSKHTRDFWNNMSLEEVKKRTKYELLTGSEDSIENAHDLVRLIRNAFAHASVKTTSIKGEIESVIILGRASRRSQRRLEIRLSIQGLKELALMIADYYLSQRS